METGVPESVENRTRISVIVPVYNGEKYLAACLDSILVQTWPEMEIIIVDDGSTDRSGNIADWYYANHKGQIQVLHQVNSGVSKARFNGIQVAQGEWIGFADADDVIETDMYERLMKNAIEYRAQISHCGYQTIVNNGERVHYFYNTGKRKIQSKKEGVRDLLRGELIEPSLCNKIFHHSLFDKIIKKGRVDLSLRYNEDLFLNYLLFKESDSSVFEDFCPYHYMARPQTATRKDFDTAKYTDPVKVWRMILQEVPQDLKTTAVQKYLFACYYAYAGFLYKGHETHAYDEYRNELLKYKSEWHNLRGPDRLRVNLIMKSPALYQIAARIYTRVFQNKRYE